MTIEFGKLSFEFIIDLFMLQYFSPFSSRQAVIDVADRQ